jgi:outer membrane protein assembly factor BamB
MVALDAETGSVRWRYDRPSHAQPYTAAVASSSAFVVSEDGAVASIEAQTGAIRWSVMTETPIEALPSIADGVVYVAGNDGPVSALDATTGARRWSVPIHGVPFAPSIARGYVFVGTSVGTLYAIGGPAR